MKESFSRRIKWSSIRKIISRSYLMCEYAIIRTPGLKCFSLSKLIVNMEEGSFNNAHLTCIKYISFNLFNAAL